MSKFISVSTILMVAFSGAAYADVKGGLSFLEQGEISKAAGAFEEAFEAGDGDGAFYLGRLFEYGVGVDVDTARAANLYNAGVEQGSTLAMNRLGLMYLQGDVLLRDYSQAAKLFCDSADLDDVDGQLNCALMLREGKGVDVDVARAVEHFEAAATAGNIVAANLLGQMYLSGESGVDANEDRAFELFEQTAEQGNAMGLYELARLYAPGEGHERADIVQAYNYANLAVVRQHEQAPNLRDVLEAQMSAEQISTAQALSREWTNEKIAEQALQ